MSGEKIKKNGRQKNAFGILQKPNSRKIAISAILIAMGVSLSVYPGSFPVGPTRVFPFQHMINGISGVILGPINAVLVALAIALLRMSIGTGTVFALSGGIPGALVVGVIYYYIRNDTVALIEPIGTTIGAMISAFIVAPAIGTGSLPPFIGLAAQWQLFTLFFLMSSVPGAILGYIVLVALRRSGVLARLSL